METVRENIVETSITHAKKSSLCLIWMEYSSILNFFHDNSYIEGYSSQLKFLCARQNSNYCSRKVITLNTHFTIVILYLTQGKSLKILTLKFFITLGWILINNSKHYVRALVRLNFNTGFEQTDSTE